MLVGGPTSLLVGEPAGRQADRFSDRGRVAGDADLDAREGGEDEAVIDGQRTLREGVLAEHDQSEPVAGSLTDELGPPDSDETPKK